MASVREARRFLRDRKIDAVVGFGGYASAPAYVAARWEHVPLLVHEANARPGWANRLGARLTRNVAAVNTDDLPHARAVGMPLREAIRNLDRQATAEAAQRELGVRSPVLLVFGGSQGARRLNDLVASCLDMWLADGITVVHVYGSSNTAPSPRPGYLPMPFTDRMDLLYAAADLVICRAGAMTCAEVAAVGLPAIYVPLPVGNGEQELNALPTVRAGGGLLIRDQDVTPAWLTDQVGALLRDEPRLREMGARARAQGVRDADRVMADWVIEIAEGGRAS
jgi:UDP-N-acetylglucosamine--N-acetylmuramyl-(pentapeptide) pyrophosphoryl-undecaprenol N-acetylglucosamine transferase